MKFRVFIFACTLLIALSSPGQKIGLVLSGGGASGLCHIGVLKALEENGITVDYISGTSIGSLIGAYYATGYSPEEIEEIVKTYFFQSITRGDLPAKYEYMVKKRSEFAAWLTFRYNFYDNYLKNLPTNVINSIPIDYYLMETFTGASNSVHNNFDSLMIPFRCVAADIENKKTIVFRRGDLPTAIRASMSYPFYLRPISMNGKLLFDGGLYNNFPTDVMTEDFNPDFIIGSNVAEQNPKPDEDNLYLQLRSLLMSQTNFTMSPEKGVLIEPWCDVNVFNFENTKSLIDSGYAAAMRAIPEIKKHAASQSGKKLMDEKRKTFRSHIQPSQIMFNDIEVIGFNKKQTQFITKSIFFNREPFTLNQLKKRYFRLTSDDKIKNIFPVAVLDSSTNTYTLRLIGKKEKPFYLEPGAIISNRPISSGFLGLQYNRLGKIGFSAYINGYVGKLYTGSFGRLRFDFPGKTPLYVEPSFTYSRWDYYTSSVLFYSFEKPAYLLQEDKFGEIKAGVPVGNISQFNIAGGFTEWKNQYYQGSNFSRIDTADVTYFDYWYAEASYKINTLNRRMYATDGTYLCARARYLEGQESYYPGTTSADSLEFKNRYLLPWLQIKLTFDSYIKTFRGFKIGVFLEGVYSTQGFFNNYKSTILSAPAFNPTPESQTFFIDAYRAHNYVAGGLKAITSPARSFDIRIEGYVFQPYQSILENSSGKAYYSTPFLYRYFSGMAALVYNSAIGPISIGVNYYDQSNNSFSPFFHIGYIIFNRKSID
ncbi:MAG: patatin-like phospholipase family protein [Bacteroidia bacterium]|nr:patatin-like phospholipase family protein [Bacteroidia bacterium]